MVRTAARNVSSRPPNVGFVISVLLSHGSLSAACRFEQLDRIAGGIFQQDLPAARPLFQLIAKVHAALLELSDDIAQTFHAQDDPVPAT